MLGIGESLGFGSDGSFVIGGGGLGPGSHAMFGRSGDGGSDDDDDGDGTGGVSVARAKPKAKKPVVKRVKQKGKRAGSPVGAGAAALGDDDDGTRRVVGFCSGAALRLPR